MSIILQNSRKWFLTGDLSSNWFFTYNLRNDTHTHIYVYMYVVMAKGGIEYIWFLALKNLKSKYFLFCLYTVQIALPFTTTQSRTTAEFNYNFYVSTNIQRSFVCWFYLYASVNNAYIIVVIVIRAIGKHKTFLFKL